MLVINVVVSARVNIDYYNELQAMGYGKGAAAEALRQANNNITLACQVQFA